MHFFTQSGKIYTWQKFFTQTCLWCLWQIWGMKLCSEFHPFCRRGPLYYRMIPQCYFLLTCCKPNSEKSQTALLLSSLTSAWFPHLQNAHTKTLTDTSQFTMRWTRWVGSALATTRLVPRLAPKSHPLIAQVQKYKLTNTLAPHLSPPTQTHKTHTGVPLTVRRSGTRSWWMWLAQRCKPEEKLKDSPTKSPNEASTDREGEYDEWDWHWHCKSDGKTCSHQTAATDQTKTSAERGHTLIILVKR